MENDVCKNIERCPIFVKGALVNDFTGVAYRNTFCLMPGKYKECKRYLAAQATGKPVPENIMPNSKKTLEEIINLINSK
ncbi:MAG: hypothetical protein J6T98_01835 [Salinivirgaceae bacterium]|nr:hypothetical protein [Salinivirgaceae bacterium]